MRSLLKYGADPDSRNNNGATPEAVVPGDEKGNAAKRLFREPRGKWRAKLPLAMPGTPPQCSDEKQEVCKDFFVTVKFYWRGKGLSWSQTASVYKMVYDRDTLKGLQAEFVEIIRTAEREKSKDGDPDVSVREEDIWKWIHFPANNVKSCPPRCLAIPD
jgi:hypothetical protein